jgi:gluconate 5-dehydrogenase
MKRGSAMKDVHVPDTAQSDSLRGLRALVTGGGTGVGFCAARALAAAGACVAICGRRPEMLEVAANELKTTEGPAVVYTQADVTSKDDVARLRDVVGPVDILVNNAGYSLRSTDWRTVPVSTIEEVWRVNALGPVLMSQAFVPDMVDRGFGRVVNVSSIFGIVVPNPKSYGGEPSDNCSYAMAKSAIIGWTRFLASTLGGTGVTANVISPGVFGKGQGPGDEARRRASAESMKNFVPAIPAGRTGGEHDLDAAFVFLSCPGSAYVTGHNLVVDGGYTIW